MQRHIYIYLHNHQYFPYILINDDANNFLSFNSLIKRLLFAVVVAESCLMKSEKNNETLHDVEMILWMCLFLN